MNDTPACWSWSVTSGHLAAVASCPETFTHLLLWNWQRGQCATCGVLVSEATPLVRDRDPATGRIRGLLCQSCNTNEGHTAAGIKPQSDLFDRYRAHNPATMLQLQARHECTAGPFGRRLPKHFAGSVMLPTLGERWTLQDIDWGTTPVAALVGASAQLDLDFTDYWMTREEAAANFGAMAQQLRDHQGHEAEEWRLAADGVKAVARRIVEEVDHA